jgi:predicted dienelactone hydrolase
MRGAMRNMRGLRAMGVMWVIAAAMTTALATDGRIVGFERIEVQNAGKALLQGGVWYPASGGPSAQRTRWDGVVSHVSVKGKHLLLIVLSHGGGGSYDGHYDTAIALARAGFVVAAVNHAGDDHEDQSRVMELWHRPEQLHRLISYMLQEWPERQLLDKSEVGAFGFSNGGFTVLVAAGGVPDLSRVGPYCQAHPEHDLCAAMRHAGVDPRHPPIRVPKNAWISDARIKAVVVAAPAFGFTFSKRGLSGVRVPVQLWRAKDDRHQPNPYYDEAVREALPVPPEYHVISGAGHYDFLPPCSEQLAAARPDICSDRTAFNRAAFHAQFNASVVRFFRAHLMHPQTPSGK